MELDAPPAAAPPCIGARVWLVRVCPDEVAPLAACCFAAQGLVALWHEPAAAADVILEDGSEAYAVPAALLAEAPAGEGRSHDEHASRGVARWPQGHAAAAAAEFAAALAALPGSGAPPPGAPPPPRVGAAALVRHSGVYRRATICCVDAQRRTADVMFDGDDAPAAAGAEDEASDVAWHDGVALLSPLEDDERAVLPYGDVAHACAATRAWTNLARALLRAGCAAAARAAASAALAWRPAHAPALLLRGMARATPPERDLDAAAADLMAAAALRPASAEPREALRHVARLRADRAASDRRLALAVAGLAREAAAGRVA